MKLLERHKLVKTGPVDYADWNYRLILGQVQRLRFSLALSLLPLRSGRLLEIGYGSGVLMPSLAERADELFGVDVHDQWPAVAAALATSGVRAALSQASAEDMPFARGTFDAVVAVSALSFISDLPRACREIRRVLRPGGIFVAIDPGESPLVDAGLKLLTGISADRDYGDDQRSLIIPTLEQYFRIDKHRVVPRIGGQLMPLYHGVRLVVPADSVS